MTGKRSAAACAGVQTFEYRQSSSIAASGRVPNREMTPPGGCGAAGGNAVASRIPDQDGTGCGGRQRNAPTGGAAYGNPR